VTETRPAAARDRQALFAINAAADASALSTSWIERALGEDDASLLLVITDAQDSPAGFCLADITLDEASLLLIAVLPVARRRGLGAVLLAALDASLAARGVRRCLLEVRESSESARRLYRRCGYREDGRRRAYYPGGEGAPREDAILMSKSLENPTHGST
jgi:ribosomal-protein-alanine N-acetyltransferase